MSPRRKALVVSLIAAALVTVAGIGGELYFKNRDANSNSTGRPTPVPAPPLGGDFPTYLADPQRTDAPTAELLINASSAAHLHTLWVAQLGGGILTQPVILSGSVYVGGRDGFEYGVNTTSGAVVWKRFAGLDGQDPSCGPTPYGVSSTSTLSSGVDYFAGGNATFYALNGSTGSVLWEAPSGNTTLGYYDWGSPLIYGGYAYLGVSSLCDQPIVPGGLLQISLTTHRLVHRLNTTVGGAPGDAVWSTPSINGSSNTIFVTTGNGPNGYVNAIVSLNASTLQVLHSWSLPLNQTGYDSDFGGSPMLFAPAGGPAMVAAINKNGILYVWYQSNLSLAWERRISNSTDISTPAWDGSSLFAIGNTVNVSGRLFGSAVEALSPSSGRAVWLRGLPYPQSNYVSPLWVNGVLVVPRNSTVFVVNATSGSTIYSATVVGTVVAPASISRGVLYVGTTAGYLYAFGVSPTFLVTGTPTDPAGGSHEPTWSTEPPSVSTDWSESCPWAATHPLGAPLRTLHALERSSGASANFANRADGVAGRARAPKISGYRQEREDGRGLETLTGSVARVAPRGRDLVSNTSHFGPCQP